MVKVHFCKECVYKHPFPFYKNAKGVSMYACLLPNKKRRKYYTRFFVHVKTLVCKYFKK
jgi:hypothetical protein